jgi:hypothetical protein
MRNVSAAFLIGKYGSDVVVAPIRERELRTASRAIAEMGRDVLARGLL